MGSLRLRTDVQNFITGTPYVSCFYMQYSALVIIPMLFVTYSTVPKDLGFFSLIFLVK